MKNAYSSLVEKFKQLAQLDHAMTFLQWDQLVMMPPAGNDSRSTSIAELASMRHEKLTSSEIGDLLNAAVEQPLNQSEKRSLFEMSREWKQAMCLPARLVKAQSLAGSKCEHGWRTQRKSNDWQGFLTNFREVVELSREEAQLRQAVDLEKFETPYDALLDLYCTGDSSEFIGKVFSGLKQELPILLEQILANQKEPISLTGTYPIEEQKRLNEQLMLSLGFNFEAGRLDVSMHPFSTGGRGDQRITTRFRDTDFSDALQGTAHETGHASYEAGLPEEWDDLPVGEARNMCIHESQSLLFEKQIFLSRPFTHFFTEAIHKFLPDARRFDSEQIWYSSTKVQPSLIRVEADEVTYPLHVVLRFEIERDLMNGVIQPADIPGIWHEKMIKYLGLSTKDNYTDGCLQDIHWTDGSFGYFPSYTLGALNGAQLFAAIQKDNPDWQEMFQRGDINFVRNWLRDAIWSKGSTMDSQDIITAATGEGTNPQYFLDHIRARYIDNAY